MPVPPQVPVIQFVSPAYGDFTLVEAWNTELAVYTPLPYGTPHPNVEKWSGYILVKQEPLAGEEKWVLRYWTADPAVENTYNTLRQSFDGEDVLKDIVVRTYLIRRADYLPAAKKSTLSGVLYVRITNGGSGYDATTTVTFTGGGGSGATGVPLVFRGAIVGVYMTAEGTGYTNNPYVTFAGIGTGATATAGGIRQNASAILVEEQADRMEGGTEDGIYLKVTRVYHVLPGAEIVSYTAAAGGKLKRVRKQKVALPSYPTATGYGMIGAKVEGISTVMGLQTLEDWVNSDGTSTGTPVPFITHRETIEPEGVELMTWVKTVDSNTLPPPVGATSIVTADATVSLADRGRRRIPTFPTGITSGGEWETVQAYVVHAELRAIEDSMNLTLIVQTAPIPRTRYEFPSVTFQFPAVLIFNNSFTIERNGRFPLNYNASAATYTPHRTRRVVAAKVFRYTITPGSPVLGNQFKINAPGQASIYFGQIDANTIYQETSTPSAGYVVVYNAASAIIEKFPFSTLSGCAPFSNATPGTDEAIADGTLPVFYRVQAEQNIWRGAIYAREYLALAEDRDIVADAQAQRFAPTDEGSATGTQYLFCG